MRHMLAKFLLLAAVRKIVYTVLEKIRYIQAKLMADHCEYITLGFAIAEHNRSRSHQYSDMYQRELRIWKAEREGVGSTNTCVCCAVHLVPTDRI